MTSRPRSNFLALGDSYTIGEGVPARDRWPVQLARCLRDEGRDIDDPEIIATTGWTTDELWAAIDRAAPTGDRALASLLIGVNDQYRGRPVAQFREEFRLLLDRAIGLASGKAARVMVLAIPDWGVTPFAADRDRAAIAHEIDAFNRAKREETLARGAHYIDTSSASRAAAGDASLLAADGLHPSGRLYERWVDLVMPVARGIL